jgi:hypothetical protein
MEIVRLVAVHLLVGCAIVAAVAAWVVARWAALQFRGRSRWPGKLSALPKVAQAKIVRGLARDLLLQSAD